MKARSREWTDEYPKVTSKILRPLVKAFDQNGYAEKRITYSINGTAHLWVTFVLKRDGIIEWNAFEAHGDKELKGRVHFIRKPCHFGGNRFYFLCPSSGEPCLVLYLWRDMWRSRQAAGLYYATESESDLNRLLDVRDSIERKMAQITKGRWDDRPIGRRHEHYDRLLRRRTKIDGRIWAMAPI